MSRIKWWVILIKPLYCNQKGDKAVKITLKDIADETGYSISTVSRVLNGSDKISSKARKEIVKTARRLNYPLYNSNNGGQMVDTLRVFLVVSGFHVGEFYASFYDGMNQAADKNNIVLSLVSINKPFDELVKMINKMISDSYDGVILFTPELAKSDYETLADELPDNFPVISNGLIENPVFTTITFDGYSGGFLAAEHFMKKGYRRCGIIQGPFDKAESRNRANGFRDHITQCSDMEIIWDYQGDFTFESGLDAFKSFDNLNQKPEAIFACNDAMCHGFMEASLIENYRFPEDIAIVGYDDLPICERHRPTISSIHTSYKGLGNVTMEKLREINNNPKQQKGVLSLVPVELIERESS